MATPNTQAKQPQPPVPQPTTAAPSEPVKVPHLGELLGEPVWKAPGRKIASKNGKTYMVARAKLPLLGMFNVDATVWASPEETSPGVIETEYSIALPFENMRAGVSYLSSEIEAQAQEWIERQNASGSALDKFLDATDPDKADPSKAHKIRRRVIRGQQSTGGK